MQRMDPTDSSKGKTLFKKRIHRPWKPTLLENALEDSILFTLERNVTTIDVTPELTPNNQATVEISLEQNLADKTKECDDIHQQLTARGENRVLIGGFLYPRNIFSASEEENLENSSLLMNELKSKEQEILLLSSDLKTAKALEQAEKLEISRQMEEEARKSAEEKALFAIQQAKFAAEQVFKIEQQLNLERKFRAEDEKIRKSLEDKIQKIYQDLETKEQLILKEKESKELALQREIQSRTEAEEQIKNALEYANITEQRILKETEEKIKHAEAALDEKMRMTQEKIDKKIEEAQEQAHFHEKAKVAAQNWAQKALENVRNLESAKKGIEEKLQLIVKQANEDRIQLEQRYEVLRIDSDKRIKEMREESQKKVEMLLEQIRDAEKLKAAAELEKARIDRQFIEANKNIKKLESIVFTERNLRKIQEDKLTETQIRKDELKRKAAEDKILDLAQEIGNIEIEKAKSEARLSETKENLTKLEILMESEKTIRKSMEDKINEFMEKVHQLEQLKQNEKDGKQVAERKISVLLNQQQHLEQEKAQHEEKLNKAIERTRELEVALESEKYFRKEAERAKLLEEQARKAAQEKISHAIEQANKTVLNVLGAYSTTPSSDS